MNIRKRAMEVVLTNTKYYTLSSLRSDDKYSNLFIVKADSIPERKFVQRCNIPYTEIIYGYPHNNEWRLSTSSYCRAKILISKKWIESKLPEANNSDNNTNVSSFSELLHVPKMIIDGNEVNIEVRSLGPLSLENILFRCRDVGIAFGIQHIKESILNEASTYIRDIDYKSITINGGNKSYLYITFQGLMRVVFVSRVSKVSVGMQRWIAEVIYTCQYGNRQERMSLVKNIIPDYAEIINDIFGKFEFSCIYLLKIGNYDNYTDVYKFGRTNNFNRRYKEHNKTYNTVCSVCLLQYIDDDYLSKAETEVHNYMADISALIETVGHDELVTLSDKQVKSVNNIYKNLGYTYAANNIRLQDIINSLRHSLELSQKDKEVLIERQFNEISKISHLLELAEERHSKELSQKDTEISVERHVHELLQKDIQLIKMENELLKIKHNIA